MSNPAINSFFSDQLAVKHDLTASAALLLLIMILFCQPKEAILMPYKYIMTITGLTKLTILNSIKALRQKGLIEVTKISNYNGYKLSGGLN